MCVCSLEKEKKAVDKENVEFEYLVACLQEVNQRLEKDNGRLEQLTNAADEKIVEVGRLAAAARGTQTSKRDAAKEEKKELQQEVRAKAEEERMS